MTDLRYELIPLRECFDDALAFRNANRTEARDARYLTWRYLARPCSAGAYVAWMWSGGKPVAAATMAAHDFACRGESLRLGVIGDISVSTEQRGRGLGRALLEKLRESAESVVAGCVVLPNEAVLSALRRAEWEEIGELRRSARVLRAPSPEDGAALPRRLIKRSLAGTLALVDAARGLRRERSLELVPVPSSDPGLAALWDQVRSSGCFAAVRDAAYIQWRYEDHPIYRYELLALRIGGKTRGYAVLRRDERIAWIEDAIAVDRRAAAALALALVERAAATPELLELHVRYSSTAPPGVPWWRFGFVPRPDRQAILGTGAACPGRGEGRNARASLYAAAGDKDV